MLSASLNKTFPSFLLGWWVLGSHKEAGSHSEGVLKGLYGVCRYEATSNSLLEEDKRTGDLKYHNSDFQIAITSGGSKRAPGAWSLLYYYPSPSIFF